MRLSHVWVVASLALVVWPLTGPAASGAAEAGCVPAPTAIDPPAPAGVEGLYLQDVQVFGDGTAVALGMHASDRSNGLSGEAMDVLRWDGSSWGLLGDPVATKADRSQGGVVTSIDGEPLSAWTDRTGATAQVRAVAWDGARLQPVPLPSTAASSWLGAGDAVGNETWLVGNQGRGGWGWTSTRPLVFRSMDGAWERLKVPAPPIQKDVAGSLDSVAVRATDDVWIGGTAYILGGPVRPLLYHWNGGRWANLSATVRDRVPLGGVFALDAGTDGSLWMIAGGDTSAGAPMRWNGSGWSKEARGWTGAGSWRSPSVSDLDAVSADEVWVVSLDGGLSIWNGDRWRFVANAGRSGFRGSHGTGVGILPSGPIAVGWVGYGRPSATTICPQEILDGAFGSRTIQVRADASSAAWRLSAANEGGDRLIDDSGLSLFDSGSLQPGQPFAFTYPGAGRYRYREVAFAKLGVVAVPVLVRPHVSGSGSVWLQWAGTYAINRWTWVVQVRPPGSTDWDPVPIFRSQVGDRYVAADGAGTYDVRARSVRLNDGAMSPWSPVRTFDITG